MNIQPTPEMQAIMRENDLLDQLATLRSALADRERELGEAKAKCASVEAAYSILSNSGKTFFDLAHDLKDASARAERLRAECEASRSMLGLEGIGWSKHESARAERYHAARSTVDAHCDLVTDANQAPNGKDSQ